MGFARESVRTAVILGSHAEDAWHASGCCARPYVGACMQARWMTAVAGVMRAVSARHGGSCGSFVAERGGAVGRAAVELTRKEAGDKRWKGKATGGPERSAAAA